MQIRPIHCYIPNIRHSSRGVRLRNAWLAIAGDTNARNALCGRYLLKNGNSQQAPVIDYQKGSLRDDFDFGSLLFFRSSVLKQAVRAMDADYRFAGLYDLRLRVSELAELVHVNEYLYSEVETDIRKSGGEVVRLC